MQSFLGMMTGYPVDCNRQTVLHNSSLSPFTMLQYYNITIVLDECSTVMVTWNMSKISQIIFAETITVRTVGKCWNVVQITMSTVNSPSFWLELMNSNSRGKWLLTRRRISVNEFNSADGHHNGEGRERWAGTRQGLGASVFDSVRIAGAAPRRRIVHLRENWHADDWRTPFQLGLRNGLRKRRKLCEWMKLYSIMLVNRTSSKYTNIEWTAYRNQFYRDISRDQQTTFQGVDFSWLRSCPITFIIIIYLVFVNISLISQSSSSTEPPFK